MNPTEFSDALIEAYRNARESKYPHTKIRRGGNHSVASEIEDLLAFYLAGTLRVDEIWVNQQLSISTKSGDKMAIKPDLAIIHGGVVRAFVEIKMDIGFARKEIGDYFSGISQRVRKVRGRRASYRDRKSPRAGNLEIEICGNAECVFVIVSGRNASKTEYEKIEGFARKNKVHLHTLLRDIHPNDAALENLDRKCAEKMTESLRQLQKSIGTMLG